ncbi:hypothetical protein [Brevundimonas sp. SL161]|uniref:hypothetical protein n=1 Tax=Brevundimonas sp. SL161 TaxID=2804613 RepID=UPI003CEFDAD2
MQKLLTTSIMLVVALTSTACATKRYPIATTFSAAEASAMDCGDLNLELIRAEQVQAQIADTANLDWRSAAGFLGDFGIGNAMARSDADKAITQRITAIRTSQVDKACIGTLVGGS